MQLYRSETGCQVSWDNTDIIDSLDAFKTKVRQCTGIEIERQILMTSFGTQVKETNVKEVTTASGQEEYIVFVYDREYLSASEEQMLKLIDEGTPRLEPEIRCFDDAASRSVLEKIKDVQSNDLGYTCKLYLSLFSHFDTCAQSLIEVIVIHTRLAQRVVEEQKKQWMALNVAMTNLRSHNTIAEESVSSLSSGVQKDLTKQSTLTDAADMNIRILKSIRIHPAILQALGETRSQRTLMDYLDIEELETSKNRSREFCTTLEHELQELRSGASMLHHHANELQQQITDNQDPLSLDAGVSDIQGVQEKAHFLSDQINRNVNRVFTKVSRLINIPITSLTNQIPDINDSVALSSSSFSSSTTPSTEARDQFKMIYDLAVMYINEEIPKIIAYEKRIRRKAADLIGAKRQSVVRFLEYMHRVSDLQSDIASVMSYVESIRKWKADYKRTNGGRSLEVAEEVIYAYAYLLLEMARRKEYSTILLENSNATADLLASYRTKEQKRRDRFLRKYIGMLPFKVSIENDTTPHCEISTVHLESDRPEISRSDVIDFVRILGQYYAASPTQPGSPRLDIKNRRRTSPSSPKIGKQSLEESASSRSARSQLQESGVVGGSERFIDLLHTMSQELDGLKAEFLKAVETSFFSSVSESRLMSEPSDKFSKEKVLMSFNASQIELQQKSRALEHAEERLKNYEARIASLEKALQNSYRIESTTKSKDPGNTTGTPSSGTSSQYSLVDEASNRDVGQLQETVKEQERYITDLQKQMHTEQEMWENEREDFKLQIQELEQLLEEERQTYEYNRRSLLKEAQVKDDLADMRVASIEDDYKAKIQELEAVIDNERKAHQKELEKKDMEIKELADKSRTSVDEQSSVAQELDQLKKEYASYKEETENRLQELDNTEQARDNIKQQLAKARDMVSRAENDWMSKQEALEKALHEQKEVQVALVDLVSLYGRMPNEMDISSLLDNLKACMEAAASNQTGLENQLADLDHEYEQLAADMHRLDDEYKELRLITTHMAEKLEGYRKDIFYELTHQLQLSIDEEEAMAITKRIIVSDQDDDMALWNNVLQASKGIDPVKFVNRIREKVKEAHDMSRRWKREYKEKYSKLASNSRDKIAFRNFQVGDVALFLPTRNSTGKPWAAFNINAPHYFLKPSDTIEQQMQHREWMVARITSITELTVTSDPQSNPYGLADGLTYYHLEVENWKSAHHRKSHHKSQSRKAGSSSGNNKSKGKESAYTMIPKSPPAQDTGLASIGESSTSAPPSSPLHGRRPSFPTSLSTSNVVHSYVPTNSPPSSSRERRHSYFGSTDTDAISPTLAWTQPQE
ncbi:autophagy-related protein 11 [Lichtheimia corymbifera JMRC:FSU:9682]|uniref:Autophagy-related protein 11 n=1 Tax=Lichtheimia corymbifera JMRC:FSU:9682 TaxID=1263082 RepID=A0A068RYM9_9FUNG|nr:autophagy-related protein 11 [Lichtheimia corymbifera JMRC:FSU:9682]